MSGRKGAGGGGTVSPGAVPLENVSRFLRTFSHDFRNDLNAVELLAAYLQEVIPAAGAAEEFQQLRASVRYAAQRVQRVSKALQVADVQKIPYPVCYLVEDLRKRLSPELGEGSGRVLWDVCPTEAFAWVDAELVFDVLLELLNNAAAFSETEAPLKVRVAAASKGGEAGVEWIIEQPALLRPEGMEEWGIAPLSSSRKGGYGLGLFRVRRILEKHGASLSFRFDEGSGCVRTEVFFPEGGDE